MNLHTYTWYCPSLCAIIVLWYLFYTVGASVLFIVAVPFSVGGRYRQPEQTAPPPLTSGGQQATNTRDE